MDLDAIIKNADYQDRQNKNKKIWHKVKVKDKHNKLKDIINIFKLIAEIMTFYIAWIMLAPLLIVLIGIKGWFKVLILDK